MSDVAPERVVVIDDDHAMRLSCRQILARMGFAVEVFDNGADGLTGVARLKPALVVVDLKMPGIGGLEVVSRVHEMDAQTIIIVITGYATIGTAVEAIKSGAYDFLPKPFSPDELRVIVNRGLERRALLKETQQLREDQEQLRRRFVTFVSHQLQSPLSAIHQYLDVLKRIDGTPASADRRAEWLDRCLERTAELQALIRDWLTLSRIESGSFVQTNRAIDLREIVRTVVTNYQTEAEARGLELAATALEQRCTVRGDRTALTILLENLVVNALKYNRPAGRVTVSLECRGNEIRMAVADTGIGIPVAQQGFLFNEFFRVHTDQVAGIGGSGLGLAICRRIAAELGGAIELESTENVGSTFRVLLPLAHEDTEAANKGALT